MGGSSSVEIQLQGKCLPANLRDQSRFNGTRTFTITKNKDGQMTLTCDPYDDDVSEAFTEIEIKRSDGKIVLGGSKGLTYLEYSYKTVTIGCGSDGYDRFGEKKITHPYELKGVVLDVEIGKPEHDLLITELKSLPSKSNASDVIVTEVDNGTMVFMSTSSQPFIKHLLAKSGGDGRRLANVSDDTKSNVTTKQKAMSPIGTLSLNLDRPRDVAPMAREGRRLVETAPSFQDPVETIFPSLLSATLMSAGLLLGGCLLRRCLPKRNRDVTVLDEEKQAQ